MKYPRTPHFRFSPNAYTSKDDKILQDKYLYNFINTDIVMTEKLDGGNTCLKDGQVYARSHSMRTSCKSFDAIKRRYASIYQYIPKNIQIFGENMWAIHTIEYKLLNDYFYMFSMLKDKTFLKWDEVCKIGSELGLSVVPVLFRGTTDSIDSLKLRIEDEMKKESVFGGQREGVVVRISSEISDDEFEQKIAKYVRKDHVQSLEHWSRNWKKANISLDSLT